MKSPKIHILLSTYNGEEYLVEQLDSIFRQTYQNFTLYIRDDGSSDATTQIIEDYVRTHLDYSNQIVVLQNKGAVNLGYMGSFWKLLEECPGAEYYSFCDQDDVWLPDKLQNSIDYMLQENDLEPLLYFSSFYYCSEDLKNRNAASKIQVPILLKDVLFYTPAFGFSIVINERLRDMALQTIDRERLPHDGWLQKVAAAFGKILYDPRCTAYYRRHDNAVTAKNRNRVALISNWIKNDLFGDAMKETYFVLKRFYEEYGKKMEKSDMKLLELFATDCKTFTIWRKRLFCKQRLRPTLEGRVALKICFLLNRV